LIAGPAPVEIESINPLGRELSAPPDPTVIVDPIASSISGEDHTDCVKLLERVFVQTWLD
jgi:hypothetical protein